MEDKLDSLIYYRDSLINKLFTMRVEFSNSRYFNQSRFSVDYKRIFNNYLKAEDSLFEFKQNNNMKTLGRYYEIEYFQGCGISRPDRSKQEYIIRGRI